MSKSLRNPEDQDDHKKGRLSLQPRLTRITPTALLGSWVLQPIKDMMSLGTDFETHAKWQGYIEEPAAKDFVAREVIPSIGCSTQLPRSAVSVTHVSRG